MIMINRWLWLLMATTLLLTACSSGGEVPIQETIEETGLNVYLMNSTNDALVEVNVKVDKSSTVAQLNDVLDMLYKGDGEGSYLGTIPKQDLVTGYEVKGNGVKIQLDVSYEMLDNVSRLICRSSIIKSLTAIDGIDFIEFYVGGLPLKDDSGKVYGPFYPKDIITVSEVLDEEIIARDMVLYYPSGDGNGLIQVKETLDFPSSTTVERVLIESLMNVPTGLAAVSPIPEGTSVKNVHTKDGICYVDFNEAFRINHYGGSTGEMLTVYSIVNTLTELPNISRVQFLIEGDITESFKGHLDFSQLFEYNIEIIDKEQK